MPSKPRKKAAKPKKVSKLDQILLHLARLDNRFDGVDQRFDGHDQRFESIDEQFVKMREENRKAHKHSRDEMLKLHDSQSRKIEKLQGNLEEFRDQMLTTMNAVRGEYDTSQQERIFAGAAQDRQQEEIDQPGDGKG